MSSRFLASVGTLATFIGVVWLGFVRPAGQVRTETSTTTPATATAKVAKTETWTPPRTPDGQPDLQGIWTNSSTTPLERPVVLAGKEFFTEAEAVEEVKRVNQRFRSQPKDDIHYDNAIWFGAESTRASRAPLNLRTSMIVDPPDGRIPPMTLEAQHRAAVRAEARKRSPSDGPESRSIQERCIMWFHQGPPMLPESFRGGVADYNENLQILQTPEYVVMLQEMIHDVRIIPLDGRPHVPQNIRQWFGDQRGRWEGNTLVVDTTNFTDKSNFRGSTAALHVVERFTRIAPDAIRYQFTVEDPTTWTKPWSAEIPMWKTQGPIFEYACHEGNYGLANILTSARAEEKAAENLKKK